jgi:hypothetical protein
MTTPAMPNRSKKLSATPTSVANATNAAINSHERRLLEATWSYRARVPELSRYC